ncbi:EAL domain-containing protein [Vibrio scophthalmi]|uniref:EAL domain-containing protein n=1 Tax=Vibrio scophthalmi TaxID=45658 RepID=UPI001E433E48|nr:EAL domain-containing protein [Vibrio scophthalmi]
MPVVIIFLLGFFFSILDNYYHTKNATYQDGQELIQSLERYIEKTASELYVLNDRISKTCNQEDKLALRGHVFHSEFIKEVGIYSKGRVICTSNEGITDIYLPHAIVDRINASKNHITIELGNSSSGLNTFFIYASINDHYGLNALMPPQRFINIIAQNLDSKQYIYQLSILGRDLNGVISNNLKQKDQFIFNSEVYPLQIELRPSAGTYQHHYFSHIWQTILVASLFSLIYLIIGYQLLAKRSIEFNLVSAIENDQIELYLQPIVDVNNNEVVGSEALVRWNHPTQGQISPEIFIPLAESLGIIDLLTKKTLSNVARFLTNNPSYQAKNYVSVNLSRVCLVDDDFITHLLLFTKRHPELVGCLLLEVTENLDFDQQQLQVALRNLKRIQKMGFQLAIDDFGTGYSGLNFIRLHRFQVMKIDQVFIKSLQNGSSITPVLISMIQLAKELNMKVIAEGVETKQQIDLLKELDVSYIQGFYYSRPIKPAALIELGSEIKFDQVSRLPA